MEKKVTLPQLKKMVKESSEPVEFSLFDKDDLKRLNSSMMPAATLSLNASSVEDLSKEKLEAIFKKSFGHTNYAYCIWINEE